MNVSSTNQKNIDFELTKFPIFCAQVLPAGHDAIIAMDEMSSGTPLPKVPVLRAVSCPSQRPLTCSNDGNDEIYSVVKHV